MTKGNLIFAFGENTLRILIIGEIHHRNAAELREKVDGKIRELSPQKVVLDLSRLHFMDSAGIGFIIGRQRTVQDIRAELAIENPDPAVLKLLMSAGIHRIAKIVTSG